MGLNVLDYIRSYDRIPALIRRFIVHNRKKLVVHGSRAVNTQSSFPYQRATEDYDMFTDKNPKKYAESLKETLNKGRKGEYHYVKAGMHKGTWKVRDVGIDLKKDTEDDWTIADFTKKPASLPTVTIGGVRYSSLEELKRRQKKILKDKKFSFRWEKSKKDLINIKGAIKRKKGGTFI